jgi:hypothetical protein
MKIGCAGQKSGQLPGQQGCCLRHFTYAVQTAKSQLLLSLIMIYVYGHSSESICAVVLHKGNFELYSYIGHNVIFSPVKKLPSAYQHVKNLLEKFNPFVSDSHM